MQDIRFTYFGNLVWSGIVPKLYSMQDSHLQRNREGVSITIHPRIYIGTGFFVVFFYL